MTNRIYGYISDASSGGVPLVNLRVQVWDRDWPDNDDFMGEAFTSLDGRFEVRFQADVWNESQGIFDRGRPDIYITVDNTNKAGKWVRLAESEVFKNHDLEQDLKIDLEVDLGEPVSRFTDFQPDRDGFHFINSFFVKPDILGIDLGEWNMGFCGGMCAGALYRFREGLDIPDDEVAPVDGSDLHEELGKRQIKAMSPTMLPKMFDWQSAPDTPSVGRKKSIGERTQEAWPGLKDELDELRPTILVLIRSSGLLGNPTDNHQVLAIGYEFNPKTLDLVLYVYDPNIPDRTQTLSMNVGLPDGRLDLVDTASQMTRGFFVNPVGEAAVYI
jgi:hypothetical protein